MGQVWHRLPLLRLMLRLALAHRPPTCLGRLLGPPRDLVGERSGEDRGKFDVKHGGRLPITRSYVREALHATSLVQRSLEGELALPPP
jgi:hypothetical protein